MSTKRIIHIVTTEKNISPFDANMALDAKWDVVIPYTGVESGEIQALVQDAIFSRSPRSMKQTGMFFGGRDMFGALGMLDAAKNAMVPPFAISTFADPSGAFTTAAGMMATVEQCLEKDHARPDWSGLAVLIAGGTGPVGMAVAVLAAEAGANVTLLSRKLERAEKAASQCRGLLPSDAAKRLKSGDDDTKNTQLSETNVVFAAAAAGVQVMDEDDLRKAQQLLVVADVNAVPPSGIAGVAAKHNRVILPAGNGKARGIGALAVGNTKYQAQHRLLKSMHQADKPQCLHYRQAYETAREYAKS